jgi:hypothetical protein
MDDARVVLIGHCGPDAYALRAAVRSQFPRGHVEMVNDAAGLEAALPVADVLLINRVLDGDFGIASGIDLIRRLAERPAGERPALLLVSNFPEAHEEAAQAGAMPGFGKRQMYSPAMRESLHAAVAAHRGARG